jgi:short-subunit dehydrogenase
VTETAIITGASMGLGEEFARQLAARNIHLLLIARGAERLSSLASELVSRHPIQAAPLPCDLAQPGAAALIAQYVEEHHLSPAWLINNAGLGEAGPFEEIDPERLRAMLSVNVVALTELTRFLLPALRRAPRSRIINVASLAAFQPIPWTAVYAASKAYVLSFSEALHDELQGTGVQVTCLCPGPTATGFNLNNRITVHSRRQGQSPAEVVRQALAASDRDASCVITQGGWMVQAQRLLPRALVRRLAGRRYRI